MSTKNWQATKSGTVTNSSSKGTTTNGKKNVNTTSSSSSKNVSSFSSKQAASSSSKPSTFNKSTNKAQTTLVAASASGAAATSDAASQLVTRTVGLQVPVVKDPTIQLILGIVNCFAFGIGVIIAGILNNDLTDVLIGVLQLVIPFVGWVWAVIWGILMIVPLIQKPR